MSLFTRKTTILAVLEATYNTDAIPTGTANAMVIRNATITPLVLETVDRDLMRPYLGASPQLVVGMSATMDFEVEIAGAGTSAVTKAAYDCLLQACGFASTVNTTVSNDYTPVSTGFKSVSIYGYIDGIKHALIGARGTVSFEFTAKQIPVMKFKFTGTYAKPTDSTNPTLTTTAWQTPLGVNNTNTTGFQVHGYSGIMQSLTIDMQNTIVHRVLVGVDSVELTDRNPTGQLVIQMPDTVAAFDYYQKVQTMTLGSLMLTQGTVPFNKFQVNCSNVQLLNPTYGDADGIRTVQFDLKFVPSSAGNDEVKFSTL